MLSMCWQDQLKNRISQIRRGSHLIRVAVVGVGNTLRGDDGVGVFLVRELKQYLDTSSALLIIEAGQAPENFVGQLRHYRPDFVLFVDAAQMEGRPGSVGVWSYEQCGGNPVSTHALPLSMVCAYLHAQVDCEIVILGVQPEVLGYFDGLSPQLETALEEIVPCLAIVLSQVIGLGFHGSESHPEFVLEKFSRLIQEPAGRYWGRS